jgi:hypothetical protein
MRKWLVAVAAVLALVGGWWYASPLWTLREMRQAAMERNADRFSSYIDYPAVRESLKAEIRKSVMQDMSAQSSRGASIGSAFALALLGPLVDAMITPETVRTMFAKQAPTANPPKAKPKLPSAANDPIIERDGFDQFRVRDRDPSKGSIIFHRFGLGWKMVGIDIPVVKHGA